MQDSKQIDELFRLMDDVCENGDAALPALEQYLQTQTDAPEIDTEASLKKFKADHKEFFVKPHRGRRLCYRVFVVAAAVFAAGTVFALATGHNPFDYAAMWDSETFGFFQSGHDDFETTEDGYTHFPDGTSASYEENHALEDSTVEYDPNAPLGSAANPIPVHEEVDPEYADVPDTDLSDVGLEKTKSTWDASHIMENFDIINTDFKTALHCLGINSPIVPNRIPQGYVLNQINVYKDYYLNTLDILAYYEYTADPDRSGFIITVNTITEELGTSHIEKDSRPVIEYQKGGTTWYIMHNLEHLNAVTMLGHYEVGFGGDISVDEMKSIIDSIYE